MSNKKLSRLKDVAIAANVSVAAASRILRGDTKPFRADTIERVLLVADQLNWRRNLLVSGMQTGQTKTVGVLIPPRDSFWINVLSGIHSKLAESDFLPITTWLGDLETLPYFEDDDEKGIALINRLLDRRVQALIAWPQIACAYRKFFLQIVAKHVPIVVIDLYEDEPLGDSVVTSDEPTSALVAEHLLKLGHRRFGCYSAVRESLSHRWSGVREQSFRETVATTPGTSVQTVLLDESKEDCQNLSDLLAQPNRPTAIFAVTDHLAAKVYQVARQLGLRVPEDLSVVGFSDLDFAPKLSPPLTTIHQQPRKIGETAAELVLKKVDKTEQPVEPFKRFQIDGWLVVRNSTAPPPS